MINKQGVINQVNISWPKDLIIRFLYVKLAPTFQRDLTYYLACSENQIAISF